MNNAHASHYSDAVEPGVKYILRGWDPDGGNAGHNLEYRDVRIYNAPTNVREFGGTRYNGNSILVFDIADLCIAHLAELGANRHRHDAGRWRLDLEPKRHDRGPPADQTEDHASDAHFYARHIGQIFDANRWSLSDRKCGEQHRRPLSIRDARNDGNPGSARRMNGYSLASMELCLRDHH